MSELKRVSRWSVFFACCLCLAAAPYAIANDACVDAIEVFCGDTVPGSTTTATFDDAGFCGTGNTAPGVWYKISHNGLITASTCNAADYDTKISVYEDGCGTLGCVAGNDDTSGCGLTTEVTWGSDGSESLILVHGFSSQTGDFDLTMSCTDVAENDVCEDAIGPLAVDSVTAGSTDFANALPHRRGCGKSDPY